MAIKPILRLPQVRELTGMSTSTIYSWLADPNSDFPKQVKLGPKAVGWRHDDIEAWLESRVTAA